MKVTFIGDIHGKVLQYLQIIEKVENSIQVGDFGLGFGIQLEPTFIDSLIDQVPGNHRFIRGNHDSPQKALECKHCILDGTVEPLEPGRAAPNIMYVGGASSIDKHMRVPGLSWWEDEQLSPEQLDGMVEIFVAKKPRIMVTHDAPEFLVPALMQNSMFGPISEFSRTRNAFNQMLYHHHPDIWVCGHWHQSFDATLDGTRYICLPELATIELDI